MVIAGRIQRYIFMRCITSLAMTLGIIVLAIVLVDVVEQMRTVGSRTQITIQTAFTLTMMKTPGLILETLPFAMLIGAILTYSQLSRRSELPAIRASGVSAWRFLGPVMVLAVVLGTIMVTVLDPLATRLNEDFEATRDRLTGGGRPSAQGVWLSQGDLQAGAATGEAESPATIVPVAEGTEATPANANAQAIIHGRTIIGRGQALENVTFWFFRPGALGPEDREFTHRIDAERAELKAGFWQLTGVVENRLGGEVSRTADLALPTNLSGDTLLSRFASSKTIPFWELPSFIEAGQAAGMEIGEYSLKYHTLLATPVLMLAMALIGAVVCLRLARSGGLSQLIGAGALAGFLLYFVTRLASGMATSGATPPEAAAWCPPLCALFAVLALLAHVEDG
jgi:lipopolysaccharide export system permease protein